MSSNFHPDGTLFIVSGPSGAGKTTLINRVREQLAPLGIELYFSVSHTTRKPRNGEIAGESYHFVSDEDFDGMVSRTEFLEWAHVHAHRYGTSKGEVSHRLERGQDVILDIDYQGARLIADDPELKSRSLNVFIIINDNLEVATECLKAAIIAKKLQTRTALEAIGRMAERFKEEDRNGRTAGRN